jgi:hypothetical protein
MKRRAVSAPRLQERGRRAMPAPRPPRLIRAQCKTDPAVHRSSPGGMTGGHPALAGTCPRGRSCPATTNAMSRRRTDPNPSGIGWITCLGAALGPQTHETPDAGRRWKMSSQVRGRFRHLAGGHHPRGTSWPAHNENATVQSGPRASCRCLLRRSPSARKIRRLSVPVSEARSHLTGPTQSSSKTMQRGGRPGPSADVGSVRNRAPADRRVTPVVAHRSARAGPREAAPRCRRAPLT